MSDRCFGWRLLLSRKADGDLSRYEWEALDDHLAGCRECREAAESDRMLHLAFTHADFGLDQEAGRRLDDSVLLALGLPERLNPAQRALRSVRELWARWEAIPNVYLAQIVGGTFAAASLTAVFLLTALHPIDDTAHAAGEVRHTAVFHTNEPPVPLESLMGRPSPRAASLWTAPSAPRKTERDEQPSPSPVPLSVSPSPQSAPLPPQQDGSLPNRYIRG